MEIKFILRGQEFVLPTSENESILDTAIIGQIDPPYSCLEGVCNMCEAVVEQGETDEKNGQRIKTCSTKARSEYLVINYDKA